MAFEQIDPPFDDPPQPQPHAFEDARSLAADLALSKAISALNAVSPHALTPEPRSAATAAPPVVPDPQQAPQIAAAAKAGRAGPELIVLGADTICVHPDGQLIGQPGDEGEARRMIQAFKDNTHQVITGIALVGVAIRQTTLTDVAVVRMSEISDDELEAYLATQQWQGKAGGYNLFDRQAAGWPITVEGDPATVVGLPMRRLMPLLAEMGLAPATAMTAREEPGR